MVCLVPTYLYKVPEWSQLSSGFSGSGTVSSNDYDLGGLHGNLVNEPTHTWGCSTLQKRRMVDSLKLVASYPGLPRLPALLQAIKAWGGYEAIKRRKVGSLKLVCGPKYSRLLSHEIMHTSNQRHAYTTRFT